MRRSMLVLGLVTLVLGVAAWLAVRDVVMALEPPNVDPPTDEPIPVVLQDLPGAGQATQPIRVPDGGNVLLGTPPQGVGMVSVQMEDEATTLARQIRDLPAGDAKVAELKSRLRMVLEKTFVERQAAQKKELAALHDRLKSLEQTLTRREALKDQIITRRLDALVDADRELWEETIGPEHMQGGVRMPSMMHVVPAFDPAAMHSATPTMRRSAATPLVPGTTSYPVPGLPSTSRFGTRPPSAVNPNATVPAPASTTSAASSADPSVKQGVTRATVLGVLRQIERTEKEAKLIESANEKFKGTYPQLEVERMEIDRRYQLDLLKVLRAEAAARQKILELSLRKAKLHADAAVAEAARTQELAKRNAISTTEFEKTRLEAESAKIDLEKAQLELDEHQKVLEIFPNEEPKADPTQIGQPKPEETPPRGN